MAAELKINAVSVVMVGEFIPRNYHPSLFAKNELLSTAEADGASIEILHPDVAAFSTEWLTVNVARDRLTMTCVRGESLAAFRDFVEGHLKIMGASPITALGINGDFHFQMPDESAWHALGHRLAPKELWKPLLNKPGMVTIQMQGFRTDSRAGLINVIVQPSIRLKNGAFVQVNDHYDMTVPGEKSTPGSIEDVLSLFNEVWDSSIENSKKIAQGVVQ